MAYRTQSLTLRIYVPAEAEVGPAIAQLLAEIGTGGLPPTPQGVQRHLRRGDSITIAQKVDLTLTEPPGMTRVLELIQHPDFDRRWLGISLHELDDWDQELAAVIARAAKWRAILNG